MKPTYEELAHAVFVLLSECARQGVKNTKPISEVVDIIMPLAIEKIAHRPNK